MKKVLVRIMAVVAMLVTVGLVTSQARVGGDYPECMDNPETCQGETY